MTPRTSSGSWSEAGRAGGGRGAAGAGADIIDLDRYMRGTRPARAPPRHNLDSLLVVDAGLGARKAVPAPRSVASSLSSGGGGGGGGGAQGKHFSHDSGVSDTSYAQRPHAHRPHRCVGGTRVAAPAPAGEARPPDSSASLRAFRSSLERALRDQQEQIARVAQLCERQAGRDSERRTERRVERRSVRRTPTDSTELSSSSRSSRDPRRTDNHRSSECKTYKIIMSKLDELNRLFAARRGGPAARAGAAPPARPPLRHDSSGSVTVSDKLVATDFPQQGSGRRASSSRLAERGAGAGAGGGGAGGAGGPGGARGTGEAWGARVVACALEIDIPPRSNVVTESVVRLASSDDDSDAGSGGSALRGSFDLDDPVHLYAQAKRLQALHATTRRARSADCGPRACEAGSPLGSGRGSGLGSGRGSGLGSGRGSAREPSLCALCRSYWRLVRRCLAAPLNGMRL